MPKKRIFKNLIKTKSMESRQKATETKAQNKKEQLIIIYETKIKDLIKSMKWSLEPENKRGLFNDRTKTCWHWIIGSSQFHYLIHSTLTAKQTHKRDQFTAITNSGHIWEDRVASWTYLPRYAEKQQECFLEILTRNPFMISDRIPFLSATPDFTAYVTIGNKKELALIEVKSTTDHSRFETARTSFACPEYMQLQTAMNVFNIKRGYLIYYYIKRRGDEIPEILDIIRRDISFTNIFETWRIQIVSGYADYLASVVSYGTNDLEVAKLAAINVHSIIDGLIEKKLTVKKFATKENQLIFSDRLRKGPCFIIDDLKEKYRIDKDKLKWQTVDDQPINKLKPGRPPIKPHLRVKTAIKKTRNRRRTRFPDPKVLDFNNKISGL